MSQVILAFDFGMKRIGVAVGQTVSMHARPLKTLYVQNGTPNWDDVKKLIEQWRVDTLVVGLPLNLEGAEQGITHATRHFIKQLKKRFKLPIYEVDERLTTVEAREQLFATGGYKKLKKTEIDSVVATLILEQWLTEHKLEQ
jgi:putative pre-16S rRNA nuclease